MRLTQEQRYYVGNQLLTIARQKKGKVVHPDTPYISDKFKSLVPFQVQKAIEIVLKESAKLNEKYEKAIKPIDEAYKKALEKVIFANNYEAVKELLTNFEKEC